MPRLTVLEGRSEIFSQPAGAERRAWHEADSRPVFVHLNGSTCLFAFELLFQKVCQKGPLGVSFLITAGVPVQASLDCGEETGPSKVAQIECVDVAQTCHWCCWVGCIEQACLPSHKSLSPRSSTNMGKMLPAKCFELPGTRCGTNSLIIVSNLQILGSVSGNTKKGMGLGRQKQMYPSTPGCCSLCAFPSRDTKLLLLSLSKSYIFV